MVTTTRVYRVISLDDRTMSTKTSTMSHKQKQTKYKTLVEKTFHMKLLFSINSLSICGSIFQLLFDKYENQLSVLINYLLLYYCHLSISKEYKIQYDYPT